MEDFFKGSNLPVHLQQCPAVVYHEAESLFADIGPFFRVDLESADTRRVIEKRNARHGVQRAQVRRDFLYGIGDAGPDLERHSLSAMEFLLQLLR